MSEADSPEKQEEVHVAAEPSGDGERPFPIVGIGASAGGLEAVSELLKHLPNNLGMGFVLVQHLDPKHSSTLSGILGRATKMPVVQAEHGMAVRPDHVYVIPPNMTLTVSSGVLQLTPRNEMRTVHLPVDQFFKSLAEDRQSGAVGIILSGNGSDGTLGLDEIKAAGGITFAQDEETAKYPGMPQSAVRSGCIDFILPPEAIAKELTRIAQHPALLPSAPREITPQGEEAQFKKILALLRSCFGVDFTAYRDTTIRRRITRRMVLHTQDNLGDYLKLLEKDRPEVEALFQDILINVTSFFREPETFEALKDRIFPEIMRGKSPSATVRIWVPGCSTGQEAYSLAMALLEFLDTRTQRLPIQIFATDLSDTVSLQKAREGLYPENIEAEVSAERLRRFFTKEDAKYRINKAIRDMCVFAKQNVAADPPFSRLDLISCRNLLIYLATPLQKRVIPTFHYALNPDGFLLLGASETVGSFADLFSLVDHKYRVYRKKNTGLRPYPHFSAGEFHGDPGTGTRAHALPTTVPADWQREADRLVLSQYAPAGVLVNENLDIIHFRGQTGEFLAPAPGEASFNVLKMAREGLFIELRSALNECRHTNAEMRREHVHLRSNNEVSEITLRVQPLSVPGANQRCFLILFEKPGRNDRAEGAKSPDPGVRAGTVGSGAAAQGLRGWWRRWLASPTAGQPPAAAELLHLENNQLRQELASTRDYLQSVIEQQDAANEELKSANEEILSSNEELQSTNEELETAKEELQSVNEELTTINEQLHNRNLELSRLNDDITNLLASANVPMVALGVDLRIRRFTPAAGKLLNLLPSDVGRPLSNLKLAVEVPDLETLVTEVIDSVQVREREGRDAEGRRYALRIYPYRTADNKIDGAVVVLVDIDQVKS
jgi:two-component system CheB/CheR fusion protein